MKALGLLFLAGVIALSGTASAQDWNIQVVDAAAASGYNSRLIATSDGIPYVLYQGQNSYITLAWYVTGGGPGGWEHLSWSDRDGFHLAPDMDVDTSDRIHLAYSEATYPYKTKYGVFDHATKAWHVAPELASASHGDLSIALWDSAGATIPFVAVSQREAPYAVVMLKRDAGSGSWSEELVWDDHPTDRPAVAVDSLGTLHVSFYDAAGYNLMYATNAGGLWVTEFVDITGSVGFYSDIVIDAGNTPYIVYYDVTGQNLKYARLLD